MLQGREGGSMQTVCSLAARSLAAQRRAKEHRGDFDTRLRDSEGTSCGASLAAPAPTFGAHCVPPSLPISSRYLSRSVVGREGATEFFFWCSSAMMRNGRRSREGRRGRARVLLRCSMHARGIITREGAAHTRPKGDLLGWSWKLSQTAYLLLVQTTKCGSHKVRWPLMVLVWNQ